MQKSGMIDNALFDWFRWNNAANESFIQTICANKTVSVKCLEIFSNMVTEHERWLNRICAVDIEIGSDNGTLHENMAAKNALIHDITEAFLRSESYGGNLDWAVKYKTKGNQDERTLREVYFHILTYSEHHRGQMAELLKGNGIEPPRTDYLTLRSRQN